MEKGGHASVRPFSLPDGCALPILTACDLGYLVAAVLSFFTGGSGHSTTAMACTNGWPAA